MQFHATQVLQLTRGIGEIAGCVGENARVLLIEVQELLLNFTGAQQEILFLQSENSEMTRISQDLDEPFSWHILVELHIRVNVLVRRVGQHPFEEYNPVTVVQKEIAHFCVDTHLPKAFLVLKRCELDGLLGQVPFHTHQARHYPLFLL